jgi:hypothetical protein
VKGITYGDVRKLTSVWCQEGKCFATRLKKTAKLRYKVNLTAIMGVVGHFSAFY